MLKGPHSARNQTLASHVHKAYAWSSVAPQGISRMQCHDTGQNLLLLSRSSPCTPVSELWQERCMRVAGGNTQTPVRLWAETSQLSQETFPLTTHWSIVGCETQVQACRNHIPREDPWSTSTVTSARTLALLCHLPVVWSFANHFLSHVQDTYLVNKKTDASRSREPPPWFRWWRGCIDTESSLYLLQLPLTHVSSGQEGTQSSQACVCWCM